MECDGCEFNEYDLISDCWKNDKAALDIFQKHKVVPSKDSIICPIHNKKCCLTNQNRFKCVYKEKDPNIDTKKLNKKQRESLKKHIGYFQQVGYFQYRSGACVKTPAHHFETIKSVLQWIISVLGLVIIKYIYSGVFYKTF